MGQTLKDRLRDRWGDDWLIGLDSGAFWCRLETLVPVFAAYRDSVHPHCPGVLIAEPDPLQFLAICLAAWSEDCTLVVANPHWGESERQQLHNLVHPVEKSPVLTGLGCYRCQVPGGRPGQILIPTGGSSGQIKFAVHSWETLMASIQGFCHHFGVENVQAYCVLPLFHVSGLMQALRAIVSGGCLAIQPYGDLKGGERLTLPPGGFLSLVPTQLQELLALGEGLKPWLRGFRAVLLGGAPAWPALLDQAQAAAIPLALTYGMTETASQVATLLPEDFLAGNRSSGHPLPHARIMILNERGQPQPPGAAGRVMVQARSLAQGYLGSSMETGSARAGSALPPAIEIAPATWATDDIGYLDGDGYLHIVGRSSAKIITGGENVFPEEIEALILAAEGVSDACVVGAPCDRWGQQLCALVTLASPALLSDLPALLRPRLAAYKQPKQWMLIPAIPRTAQGKLSRPQALALAQKILDL